MFTRNKLNQRVDLQIQFWMKTKMFNHNKIKTSLLIQNINTQKLSLSIFHLRKGSNNIKIILKQIKSANKVRFLMKILTWVIAV